MKNYAKTVGNPTKTPQSRPIPGRESEMVKNEAGGYGFKVDDWKRLDRFLIIGTEGGSYYTSEKNLTIQNAQVVQRCLIKDMTRTLNRVIEVSDQSLAPSNDPAIFALALSFCYGEGFIPLRREALVKVCRTGTHLFQFLANVRLMRGGGRAVNSAVRFWLGARPAHKLAYQMVKYRQREGWTWKDVLRRFRPKPAVVTEEANPNSYQRHQLYAWIAGKLPEGSEELSSLKWVSAFTELQKADVKDLPELIRQYEAPWELVPTEHSTNTKVMEALFESMPMMATVRQLPKLSAHGVLPKHRDEAIARLTDKEQIRKSRIHPCALMLAAKFYEQGSNRNLNWQVDANIVDALDDAFQLALKVAEPTGKKILVAIDISGSMRGKTWRGIEIRSIAAAMALTYVRSDAAHVIGFDSAGRSWNSGNTRTGLYELGISSRMRVPDVMRKLNEYQGGATDCALPFAYAAGKGYDAVVVFTDHESWAGSRHPVQELAQLRKQKPDFKAVWCAMTAINSSCSDQTDFNSMDIIGFDSSAPKLIGDFIAGRF